ncbi:MAG: AAA family ATPase [Clostridia bacterium]|nr:AAA family ATPase [Clostridia bacterium]
MRLIECYIENFGKISRQKITFGEGLNCIKDDNGSGKTTLATFIKVMLYGMSDTKKASLEENDRKHYLPWQGGVCGGNLTFSAGGKTYRVERSFAPKTADDTYVLYDTASGRVSTDFPEGLGEGLFGIDVDGFERTVFLSERALTPKSENKSISAKLSDLVGCDGDIGGMDEALKVLEEKRKFYFKKGGSGEIAETKAKIDSITRRLDSLVDVERQAEACRIRLGEISLAIRKAREDAKEILKLREDAMKRAAEVNYEKQYKEKKLSLEESVRRRNEVSEIFGTDIPSHSDIDEASYKSLEAKRLVESVTESADTVEFKRLSAKFDGKLERAQVEAARQAAVQLKERRKREKNPELMRARRIFAKRVPTEEELSNTDKLLSDKKKKTPIGCIIAYVLFAICCVVGVLIEQTIIAVGVVGILATLITEIILKNQARGKRKKALIDFFQSVCGVKVESDEEAVERLKDMRLLLPVINGDRETGDTELHIKTLNAFIALFPEKSGLEIIGAAEDIIREYDRYAELAVAERYILGDRTARLEKAEKLRGEAAAFLARFRTKTQDPFGELRRALTEHDRLTTEIVAKRDEMLKLESLYTMGEGSQKKAEEELKLLDKRRQENEALIANLDREYALTERNYNALSEELEGREELTMRKSELEELLAKHTVRYETVLLTKKYLSEAKDNMTSRYLGKTRAGFIKYAEKISGITGESFEMDTDFGITKQEGATTRGVDAYSRGTRDLFNLAARLALVDSLYEREKPFIILDDPFTAFDDTKTASALRLIKELGKDRQIIYFTCSKSRSV